MNPPTGPTPADPLDDFCQSVLAKYAESWPPTEEQLAQEFVTTFKLSALSSFQTLQVLCASLGVEVSVRPMPRELRGHNSSYEGRRTILIAAEQDFPGADTHTVLHELREIIEQILSTLDRKTAISLHERELRAETFAASVLSYALLRKLPGAFEQAKKIDKKWWRYGAYLFIGIGAMAYVATCWLLPYLEDMSRKIDEERNVRT